MQKKHIFILLAVSVLAAALRAVIIINNMETNFDNHTYYLLDTPIAKAFTVVTFIWLAVAAGCAILYGKGQRAVLDNSDTSCSVAYCTMGIIILGSFFVFAKAYLANSADLRNLDIIVAFLSVLCGVAFFYLGVKPHGGKIAAFLGLLPMLFTLFRLFSDFLSTTSAPFANSGGYHLMSLAFFLLFLLCENKAHLNMGSAALFFGFGYASLFLLLVYALPNLVLHCMGLGVFRFDYSAALSVADIVSAVYIAAKLNSAKCVPLKAKE